MWFPDPYHHLCFTVNLACSSPAAYIAGLIIGLRQANERRRYFVRRLSLDRRKPRISPVFTGKNVAMRKTTRLNSGWGFGQTNSPLSTARVLIDAVGLCLLRVSEVWRLFSPDLRRWINSFSGSDFEPRLVCKIWYFCYFFTNFGQQF